MRAVLNNNLKNFEAIISSISKIFPEIIFSFIEKGVCISAVAPNHLIVLKGLLECNFFEVYECKNAKVCAGFDSEVLNKILSRIRKNKLLICIDDEWLIFRTLKRPFRIFAIPIKEPWEIPPQVFSLDLDYKYSFEIAPSIFRQIISDCSVIAKEINILFEENKVAFTAYSETGRYVFGDNNVKQTKNLMSTIMLEELKKLIQLASISKIVKIYVSKNMPVLLEFQLIHGTISILISSKHP